MYHSQFTNYGTVPNDLFQFDQLMTTKLGKK